VNEEIPSLDSVTAEFITNLFKDVMTGIYAQTEDRLKTIEKSIESLEKQIATLVLGYGEQAVFMEALVAQIAYSSDEARAAFHNDVSQARKEMLEVMQSASKGILADEDQNIATAIADLAESKLSDSES
jgi:hypothetical protein